MFYKTSYHGTYKGWNGHNTTLFSLLFHSLIFLHSSPSQFEEGPYVCQRNPCMFVSPMEAFGCRQLESRPEHSGWPVPCLIGVVNKPAESIGSEHSDPIRPPNGRRAPKKEAGTSWSAWPTTRETCSDTFSRNELEYVAHHAGDRQRCFFSFRIRRCGCFRSFFFFSYFFFSFFFYFLFSVVFYSSLCFSLSFFTTHLFISILL